MSKISQGELLLPEAFDAQKIVDLVTLELEDATDDPEYLAGIARAVPGAPKTFGVRVPELRQIAKQILAQYKGQVEEIMRLSEAFWQEGSREHRLVALFLLAGQKKISAADRWAIGVNFLHDVADWETCDQLCHALLGQALAENPTYIGELERMIFHEDFWVRRAAIVSTVLLRRAKYDRDLAEKLDRRALTMCAQLLDDQEHYIRKAVDWTVREVIKRHEDVAYDWMMERAEAGLSPVGKSTLKLAAKKLPGKKQAHFLASLAA